MPRTRPILLALLLLGLAGCGGEPAPPPPRHEEPASVFAAADAALRAQDWPAFARCLVPSEDLAQTLLWALLTGRDRATEVDARDQLERVLARHGVVVHEGASPEELALLAGAIADREAFVADALDLLARLVHSPPKPLGELLQVEVEGDEAWGTHRVPTADGSVDRDIAFQRDATGWRIVLALPKPPEDPRTLRARAAMAALRDAARLYRLEHGAWPETLEVLTAPDPRRGEAWLEQLEPDPWGHPYRLEPAGDDVAIRSLGPDGAVGTADDLTTGP